MKLKQFVNEMVKRPVLSTPAGYKSFVELVESESDRDLTDSFSRPAYNKNNGIGVVDFTGFVVKSASPVEEFVFGCVSLDNFQNRLTAMVNDSEVNVCIINFDSPGGYTLGLLETSQLVRELSEVKPIVAYTSGLMCSAAYRIGCECNHVIASPSSYVGSIGAYSQYITYLGASTLGKDGLTESTLSNLGVKVTTIQSGEDKTVGNPFIDFNERQKEMLINDMKAEGESFRSFVKAARPSVKDEFIQGDTYTGLQNIQLKTGLVDGLCNSLNELQTSLLSIKV